MRNILNIINDYKNLVNEVSDIIETSAKRQEIKDVLDYHGITELYRRKMVLETIIRLRDLVYVIGKDFYDRKSIITCDDFIVRGEYVYLITAGTLHDDDDGLSVSVEQHRFLHVVDCKNPTVVVVKSEDLKFENLKVLTDNGYVAYYSKNIEDKAFFLKGIFKDEMVKLGEIFDGLLEREELRDKYLDVYSYDTWFDMLQQEEKEDEEETPDETEDDNEDLEEAEDDFDNLDDILD